ncbi:hypothetical protein [Micromonospora sp. RP3T]|uniref:hypothetical protein n=1 Tax=Micromonospora sp. RP3T TaxID=2135446 RepID=UPI003D756CCC
MTTGVWALVHGLAFLHLDGRFDTSAPRRRESGARRGPHDADGRRVKRTARPGRRDARVPT